MLSRFNAAEQSPEDLIDPNDVHGEYVPPSYIPASGRGNSDDGKQSTLR